MFSAIFVADTKLVLRYDFVAPLIIQYLAVPVSMRYLNHAEKIKIKIKTAMTWFQSVLHCNMVNH